MFNSTNTVQTGPNTQTAATQSVLYQLQFVGPKVPSYWVADQLNRGQNVLRYRRYVVGDHDSFMSDEMKELLGVISTSYSPFADNYQDAIVQAFVDRVVLQSVEAPNNDAGTKWAKDIWEYARLDALQGDVAEATIRDGDCGVMATWDEATQQVQYTLEEAYDGTTGVLFFYRSKNVPIMDCAIKIWTFILDYSMNILTRVNIYYPDHVEKYYAINQAPLKGWEGGEISIPQYNPTTNKGNQALIQGGTQNKPASELSDPTPSAAIHFDSEPQKQYYTMPDGTPLGIPIVHFRNRGRQNYGYSEIKSTIPLQDALNRMMYSLVINGEYNGFNILWTRGFKAPTAIRPGTIIEINPDQPLERDQIADMGRIEAGKMDPFIQVLKWLTSEMGKISRTPTTEFDESGSGGRVSGEALKMREIGLIGKAERFMTKAGNAWEDLFMLANRIEYAYGKKRPPQVDHFKSIWRSAEIRDDAQTVQNALAAQPLTGTAAALRAMAPVFDWSYDDITTMIEEKEQETIGKLAQLSSVPNFANFTEPNAGQPNTNIQVMPKDVQGSNAEPEMQKEAVA